MYEIEIKKYESLYDITNNVPKNQTILSAYVKSFNIINDKRYNKILCSISGGSDSDIMLDICYRCDFENKIDYVWFDTGLEYQATKEHLHYLEDRYNIEIIRHKAIKPIPATCKEYGQPFKSKYVSDMIHRLQKYGFDWTDRSYNELIIQYPKCKSAIKWWTNMWDQDKYGLSKFNIEYSSYLKEFLIGNPPWFAIDYKCCDFAKKKVSHQLIKNDNYDLKINGVRKAEGGARSTAYKSCFSLKSKNDIDSFRPIFWFLEQDKCEYENFYNIIHSRCYTEYGFTRTGCACCPYAGKKLWNELDVLEEHEPKLYKAVNNVFKDSYEYTRMYHDFCNKMNEQYGSYANYIRTKNESENIII